MSAARAVEVASALSLEQWTRRKRRASQLVSRWPFAAQMLALYGALLDVQERAFAAAARDRPDPSTLADYAAERVIPDVVAATIAAGPPLLAEGCRERLGAGDLVAVVRRWLDAERQAGADDYLARAAAGPVLEALGPDAGAACSGPRGALGCPRCGGQPQLSYAEDSGDPLLTAPRRLLCCRCGESWVHERMTCPGCGERATSKLSIFADAEQFPHLRADGCQSCRRYLIAVDLRKDPEAVPLVDELAALPLDLYVQELGFAKIAPNLMGIG